MPPNPSTVTTIDSHTWRLPKIRNSASALPFDVVVVDLTSRAMPTSASTPMIVIAQKVERQPAAWPRKVPSGTPSTLEMVRPANMMEIAAARRSGATRSAATTEPMPKKAP